MSLLVPVGLLQLHVLPQTHFHDGHLTGGHAAYPRLVGNPLQFAASPAYASAGGPVYPSPVYSTAYHSGPPFQSDYRSSIYNTGGLNEIVRSVVLTEADPASDEGRFTAPRVFFDDDHSEDSRVRRLQEDLREEKLRQNFHQHPPGDVPLRETRRYEKSVEGDLDFSEDKKLKLARRRKRDTAADAATLSVQSAGAAQPDNGQKDDKSSEDAAGIEERLNLPAATTTSTKWRRQTPAAAAATAETSATKAKHTI